MNMPNVTDLADKLLPMFEEVMEDYKELVGEEAYNAPMGIGDLSTDDLLEKEACVDRASIAHEQAEHGLHLGQVDTINRVKAIISRIFNAPEVACKVRYTDLPDVFHEFFNALINAVGDNRDMVSEVLGCKYIEDLDEDAEELKKINFIDSQLDCLRTSIEEFCKIDLADVEDGDCQ